MDRKPFIKNRPDFLLGALFLALGVFLNVSKGITGKVLSNLGGFWALPSTYIRILGGGLILFSGLLILLSVNWRKSGQIKNIRLNIGFEAAATCFALVAYCILLPVITFLPSTFLLVLSTHLLYKRKEELGKYSSGDPEADAPPGGFTWYGGRKGLLISFVYSVSITGVLWLAFTKLLKSVLP